MIGTPQIQLLRIIGNLVKKMGKEGVSQESALQYLYQDMSSKVPEVSAMLRPLFSLGGYFAVDWAENAFATVELSPRLAASLMSTAVPSEYLDKVLPPWQCFCIHIPEGLLGEIDKNTPTHMLVRQKGGHLYVLRLGGQHINLAEEASLAGYASSFDSADRYIGDIVPEELEQVRRVDFLLGRLLVGVCLEFDSPQRRQQVKGILQAGIKEKNGRLKNGTVMLHRPVVLDTRPIIRDYVRGTKSSVNVRTLVRGHWKNQPCGEKGQERKWLHIEPYWRGPEDGPTAIRPHILK